MQYTSTSPRQKIGVKVELLITQLHLFSQALHPPQTCSIGFLNMFVKHNTTIHKMYSNFRKYATPPDEKRCIIMEKSFLCSLGFFLGLICLIFLFGEFTDVPKKWLSGWQRITHICQFCCENFFGVAYLR